MFAHHCLACGRETLIFPDQIQRLINDDQGIVVIFECWCGESAALRTGKATLRRRRTEATAGR